MQGGVGQDADTNRDVGALLQQVDNQVIAVQLQLNIRVKAAKLGNVRHQPVQHERHGGVDAQPPGRFFLARRQAFFQLIHLRQDHLGLFEEILALFGQVHAPRGAVDQRGVELGFQARQGAADRRRRLPDLLRRSGNRAALNHADEGL
ncbi:hypothetical protein ACVWVZ_003265 [Pseudomonas tolaasii]